MVGSPETGRKAAKTTKERYGADAFVKWGKASSIGREYQDGTFSHDRELASRAGSKGGKLGYRFRKVKPGDSLKADEWGVLVMLAYRAIKLMGVPTEQENAHAMEILADLEKGDWEAAMTHVEGSLNYVYFFGKALQMEYDKYNEMAEGEARRSPVREHLRIVRNLRAAFLAVHPY